VTLARKITDLTGPGHTDRFAIGGTDLGATAVAPDGRLVSVFGDTFAGATVGGPGWRAPVVLFADPEGIGEGPHLLQVVERSHLGLGRGLSLPGRGHRPRILTRTEARSLLFKCT